MPTTPIKAKVPPDANLQAEHTGQNVHQATVTGGTAQQSRHLSARVVSIEYAGSDDIIVHLDNDQIWEQSEPASAGIYLRKGDAVNIDRELGSWWLSERSGQAIQVKRKK